MTSIRRRLTVAMWSMLVPLLVVAAVGTFALEATTRALDSTTETYRHKALPLAQLDTDVTWLGGAAFQYAGTPSTFTRLQYETAQRTVDRALGQLGGDDMFSAEDRRLLDEAQVVLAEGGDTVLEVAADGQGFPAAIPAMEPYSVALDRAMANLDEIQARADAEAERLLADAMATRWRARLLVVASLVVAIAVGAVHAGRLTRWFVHPIEQLRAAAERFSTGHLDHRVHLDRRDEFGSLADTFDTMADRLVDSRGQLSHQAFHDALTGLPNRSLLLDRTQHALDRLDRSQGSVGVLLLDVDEFKGVNDTMGHATGDELLKVIAARLEETLRVGDTAARLGGDEFVVLLEDLQDIAEAEALAQRLREQLSRPVRLFDRSLHVRASIGVAVGAVGDMADELLRRADLAMYAAKKAGRDRYARFDQQMQDAAILRADLTDALRGAWDREELVLHYQPTVDLASGRLVGVEALVRWQHPERGLVPPADFIPLAEETGLILPLGRWVLQTACAQAAAWQQAHGELDLDMSVNVSAHQLQDDDLLHEVAEILERTGLSPERLVLEVTESAMLIDSEPVRARLARLRELGLRIAVDDFGTGYSSLSYLQDFTVDVLKIDRSFVTGLGADDADSSMVESIIGLARALQLETVAEGIELPHERDAMLGVGCNLAQGFLFDRPLPAAELEARFADLTGVEARWSDDRAVTA